MFSKVEQHLSCLFSARGPQYLFLFFVFVLGGGQSDAVRTMFSAGGAQYLFLFFVFGISGGRKRRCWYYVFGGGRHTWFGDISVSCLSCSVCTRRSCRAATKNNGGGTDVP